MKVLILGASGMVGQGVLRECLRDALVRKVVCIGRAPLDQQDPKLVQVVRADLFDLSGAEDQLRDVDACFYCLGVSSAGLSEQAYRRLTYDLTVSVASTLVRLNSGMTFVYVSGAGTDSTERGKTMWARVKGATENALLRMPFKAAYMLRPGVILPMDGIKSKTRSYRVLYNVLGPLLRMVHRLSPGSMTTTRQLGLAMLHLARAGAAVVILDGRAINEVA
ncbi:MAG: NAD(P)H-binding protein [Proteobacteria bacterium]|nr:NAD(P)H-binding protein [Pseudomonadota bacterium]